MTIGQQQKGKVDLDSSDEESPAVGAAATDQLAAAAKEEQENARAKLLKKRIQVAEGERKAIWQDCEEEKAENKARIGQLKEEIKCLQECLKEARTVKYEKVLTEANYEKSKNVISAIKNMSMEEALSFLEYKKADKRKMLDKLEYEVRKLEERYGLTKMELDSIKRQAEKSKEEFENSSECAIARKLENKVYKTQANLIEAEHVFSKYRSIKDKLADESHNAQTELQDLLDQIRKQECEIERLKQSYDTAVVSRDNLKSALALFEAQVAKDRQSREIKLNHLRKQMEEHQAKAAAMGQAGGVLDNWGGGPARKYSSVGPASPLVHASTPSPRPAAAVMKSPVREEPSGTSEFFFGDAFDENGPGIPAGTSGGSRARRSKSPLWEALREPETVALLDNLKNRLGASTWDEMMERCRDQENRKLHLQKVKFETLERLASLRTAHDELEARRDQLKFRESEEMMNHRWDLETNEEVIAEERSRADECTASRQSIVDALLEIKQGASHLLELLHPIPVPESADASALDPVSLELRPEEIPGMLEAAKNKIVNLLGFIKGIQSDKKSGTTLVGVEIEANSGPDGTLSLYNTRIDVGLVTGLGRARHRSGTLSVGVVSAGKDKEATAVQGGEVESDSGEEQDIPTRVGIKRQSKKLIEANKGQARAVAEKVAASKRR